MSDATDKHGTIADIEAETAGQPIEGASLVYPGPCDGIHAQDRYNMQPEWGPAMTWADACAEIEQHGTIEYPDYDDQAPRVIAWTADRVIWHNEYDCSWGTAWLPRHPPAVTAQ